ncbi:MAG: hypothetical protein WD993_08945 [Thermoleophilaceae bacterium]
MAQRVAVVGLGMQGQLLVERVGRRRDTELVGVVDVDPAKLGRPLDDVLGRETGCDCKVTESLDEALRDADVALVTTSSRMEEVAPQLEEILSRGVDVVTTCEELGYPWKQFPQESARLDAVAKDNQVSVLGCGANPGFLMDLLPIVFSLGCERVETIKIRRSLDMRPHRADRLTRFGLGRTREELAAAEAGTHVGHVGFTQSMHCVADALGWELDEVQEEEVRPYVFANERRVGDHVTLEPGTVAVIEHAAWARQGDKRRIDVAMYFGFHLAGDAVEHGDTYEIEATDQSVSLRVKPSWGPFSTTPSTVVNLIPAVRAGAPGLLSVVDFPAKALAGRGVEVESNEALPQHDYLASMATGA